jgi:hypothetical protein
MYIFSSVVDLAAAVIEAWGKEDAHLSSIEKSLKSLRI